MTLKTVILQQKALQWDGRLDKLPEGFHVVEPEVHWSAKRDLVYFTYGDLRTNYWMGVEAFDKKPETDALTQCVGIRSSDTGEEHYRRVLPFAYWDVKSEAQMKNRDGDKDAYRPVFLDWNDNSMVDLYIDFVILEKWRSHLNPATHRLDMVEFREIDGACGRGYRPHYLHPGDWLVQGAGPNSSPNAKWHVRKAGEIQAA